MSLIYWLGNLAVLAFEVWAFARNIVRPKDASRDSPADLRPFTVTSRAGELAFIFCLLVTVICLRRNLYASAGSASAGVLSVAIASAIFYLLPGAVIWLIGVAFTLASDCLMRYGRRSKK